MLVEDDILQELAGFGHLAVTGGEEVVQGGDGRVALLGFEGYVLPELVEVVGEDVVFLFLGPGDVVLLTHPFKCFLALRGDRVGEARFTHDVCLDPECVGFETNHWKSPELGAVAFPGRFLIGDDVRVRVADTGELAAECLEQCVLAMCEWGCHFDSIFGLISGNLNSLW